MEEKGDDKGIANSGSRTIISSCPHCGRDLSPWQKVLLTIDRALVCRNCWYRIILDFSEAGEVEDNSQLPKDKE